MKYLIFSFITIPAVLQKAARQWYLWGFMEKYLSESRKKELLIPIIGRVNYAKDVTFYS
jgi:hypothetical protein